MNNYGEPNARGVWEQVKKLVNTKSKVQVNRITTAGTNIANIDIDGEVIKLYAPDGGGGGGGGSSDYNDLSNKPQIEGVTLSGDKTYSELNLKSISNTELEELLILD